MIPERTKTNKKPNTKGNTAMKKIALETALEMLKGMKKGTIHHFIFESAPKKAIGGEIVKTHDYMARVAIKNSNRKGYVEPTTHKNPNPLNEVIVKNFITKFAKSGNVNATIYPIWKLCKSTYTFRHDGIEEVVSKEVAESLLEKASDKKGEIPPMISVNCGNFFYIK